MVITSNRAPRSGPNSSANPCSPRPPWIAWLIGRTSSSSLAPATAPVTARPCASAPRSERGWPCSGPGFAAPYHMSLVLWSQCSCSTCNWADLRLPALPSYTGPAAALRPDSHRGPILRAGGGQYSICGWKGAASPFQEAPIANQNLNKPLAVIFRNAMRNASGRGGQQQPATGQNGTLWGANGYDLMTAI